MRQALTYSWYTQWGKVNWAKSFEGHDTIVAEENGRITGFGDMTREGYLDRLYTRHDNLRQGVASLIADELEERARNYGLEKIITHASITAKAFFLRRGYACLQPNTVIRQGVRLTNFIMEKIL